MFTMNPSVTSNGRLIHATIHRLLSLPRAQGRQDTKAGAPAYMFGMCLGHRIKLQAALLQQKKLYFFCTQVPKQGGIKPCFLPAEQMIIYYCTFMGLFLTALFIYDCIF